MLTRSASEWTRAREVPSAAPPQSGLRVGPVFAERAYLVGCGPPCRSKVTMSKSRLLSSEEVRTLRAELDGGATPTVWFTSSAVGVPEGRSGKVIGLDDTNEGDFIQVRPAGSKDVLSFSAAEVTLEKPPRKRKEAPEPKSGTAATKTSGEGKRSGGSARAETTSGSTATTGSGASRQATAAKSDAAKSGTSAPSQSRTPAAAESRGSTQRAENQASGKTTAPAKATRRKLPGEATVTVTADESGRWSVEVTTGKKRVLKPTSVTASAVAEAAKALHEDVAEAVEPVVEAARDKQRERVEQLQHELAEAQRKLDDLG